MREMKDSGIAWIGEIPKEWEIKKLGTFFKQRNEKVSDKEFMPLSVTMQGILPQLETAAKTNDGDNRKLVRQGDFAINSRSDRRGSCGISPYTGSVSLINTVLTPLNNINSKYYDWLFHTSMFADEYYRWGHGIVDDLWTTRWSEMKNIGVTVPSDYEQQRIATFLDEKCKEIDALIALQEEMITELQAYKQSVISEAVTKGLAPKVAMKDSGVEWIGEIPEHWEIMRLNELGSYRKGPFGSALKISMFVPKSSHTIKVYEQQNAIKKNWQLGSAYISNEYYYNVMQNFTVIPGDLIVSCAGTIGEIYEIPCTAEKGIINQALMRMRMKRDILNIHFFIHIFNISIKNVSDVSSNGSAIKNIPPFNVLKKIKVPIPSIMEQDQIIDYLDTQCTRIDSLIALKQTKIESLKEYKKSVIYEYVTGKKEVPATV